MLRLQLHRGPRWLRKTWAVASIPLLYVGGIPVAFVMCVYQAVRDFATVVFFTPKQVPWALRETFAWIDRTDKKRRASAR